MFWGLSVSGALGGHLPKDEHSFYLWVAILMAIYLCAAYLIQYKFKGWSNQDRFAMTRVFDAATFAASMMLLIGIVYPKALDMIGDTELFLLIAGFAAVVYGLHALKPR